MPDQSSMFIAGLEDADYKDEKIHCTNSFPMGFPSTQSPFSLPSHSLVWDSVYGFDMKCIKSIALREPLVDTVNGNAVCTTACKFFVHHLTRLSVYPAYEAGYRSLYRDRSRSELHSPISVQGDSQ